MTPMKEQQKTKRVGFGGNLSDHKRIPDGDPNDAESMQANLAAKWLRGHEQRELKAYLKGGQVFAHGRTPAPPMGFRPVMFRVRELRGPVQPKQ